VGASRGMVRNVLDMLGGTSMANTPNDKTAAQDAARKAPTKDKPVDLAVSDEGTPSDKPGKPVKK
jgi:hypothetical protein